MTCQATSKEQERFDIIILSHILEHIEEPQAFLSSLSGKARFFYIEVPDFEATHLNMYRQAVGTDLIYTDRDHVSEFDREEMEEIIHVSQLTIVETEFHFGVMKYWCSSLKN